MSGTTFRYKNCPFCGADQNVDHEYADYVLSPNREAAQKNCWKCGATGPMVFIEDYDSMDGWQSAADEEWNTRAGDGE